MTFLKTSNKFKQHTVWNMNTKTAFLWTWHPWHFLINFSLLHLRHSYLSLTQWLFIEKCHNTWRIRSCLPVKVSLSVLDPSTETVGKRAAQMTRLCGIWHNWSKKSVDKIKCNFRNYSELQKIFHHETGNKNIQPRGLCTILKL